MQDGDGRVKLLIHARGSLTPLIADHEWLPHGKQSSKDVAKKIRRRMARIDEEFGNPLVGVVEQKKTVSGIAVAAGAADFLIIRFERIGNIRMHNEPDIGTIDAHTKGIRGDDDAGVA